MNHAGNSDIAQAKVKSSEHPESNQGPFDSRFFYSRTLYQLSYVRSFGLRGRYEDISNREMAMLIEALQPSGFAGMKIPVKAT